MAYDQKIQEALEKLFNSLGKKTYGEGSELFFETKRAFEKIIEEEIPNKDWRTDSCNCSCDSCEICEYS